ncbi:MAG: ATP-dependent RecD-like DNA helicase [Desulfobacterales bacterium]|jgi:exodeoxyribonuclease V alpha subunit|nr:ATP-dependent RecD-like DNA helicase [Desulfobacterales bacterium]
MEKNSEHRLVDLKGHIERITYTNAENGYTIARVKVPGDPRLVTVVGNIMAPTAGEFLSMKGEWINHPKYGEQFKVVWYKTTMPATVYGIQRYLGSGLIKGIGPVMARRIVTAFGKDTLDIIESNAGRLGEVSGIGRKRIDMIRTAWEEQKEIRAVMMFLQGHGVSAAYAARIFKQYGNEAIAVVSENPYRMATDIFGIGFITADRIAQNLGFEKDSPVRAQAGILYVLSQLADAGHVYYPFEPLIEKCLEILETGREIILDAFSTLVEERRIIIEDLDPCIGDFPENNKAVYLVQFHVCERSIAFRLKALRDFIGTLRPLNADKALEWVQARLSIHLAQQQVAAVKSALYNKVMIITGGPGTGKTTIIHAILKIYARMKGRILLAAPTGRAAKRMSEATGQEAKTIHRLLEYSLQKGGFQKNDETPLACDLIIVDEASMIDTVLMHHLLKAIPPSATFILVGDVHQLPSVGPGAVLKDIIDSQAVPVAELNEIFRQAQQSNIIVNAHRINRGQMPIWRSNGTGNDFFFIKNEDPETALAEILELVHTRIPKWKNLDPVEDIQVLTPMHRGVVGAANLNEALQNILNPGEDGMIRGSRNFRVRDKVMQIKNNYDKEVYNGDIGRITHIDAEAQCLTITFDGRPVVYDYTEMDEIVLAYAVSVHKAQGSEYPVVVMPVLIQHYMLLQRNLIYTAVTRGKNLVVLVGTHKALAIGIHNNKTAGRYTSLRQRLMSLEG